MILKTKTHQLNLNITTRKVKYFEEEVCNEDENIISVLTSKSMGKGKFEFIAKLLNRFQTGFNKLPIESDDEDEFDENGKLIKEKTFDCYDFMDEWCIDNDCSITDLYRKIIEEFDVKGIIDKGMGFQVSKMIQETMQQAIEELKSTKMETVMKASLKE